MFECQQIRIQAAADPAGCNRDLAAVKILIKIRQSSVLFIKDLALARGPRLRRRAMPVLNRPVLIEIYYVSDRLPVCLSSIMRARSPHSGIRAGRSLYFLTLISVLN